MALTEIDAGCLDCKKQFRNVPTRSFLGFQRLTCPSCRRKIDYPLTPGYRIAYWLLLAAMIGTAALRYEEGHIPLPSVLSLAVVLAIVRDVQIRKRITLFGVR